MAPGDVSHQVSDNLNALEEVVATERRGMSAHQRAVEAVTRAIARPITFYGLVVFAIAWVGYHGLAGRFGWTRFDPRPYSLLQGIVTLYAATVTTAVLIAQTRERKEFVRRSAVEFHVNLLAEQKTTKIIALLEELRRDLPNVRDRHDSVAVAMQTEVDPKAVHSALPSDS